MRQPSRRISHSDLVATLIACSLSLTAATAARADDRLEWHRQLGTTSYDYVFGVAADTAGYVYLSGSTRGSLGGPHRGNNDAWLVKYDPAGRQIWKRQLGSEKSDRAFAVATNPLGGFYVVGETEGSLSSPDKGKQDAWVAKYDAGGHRQWLRQPGTKRWEYGRGVATDGDGNVYLVGYTQGSLASANEGGYDVLVIKYDPDGHPLWKQQFGTTSSDFAVGGATDADGNIVLTGFTEGPLGGPPLGENDAWVAKFDTNGNLLWTQKLGTASSDSASGVATDAAGNVYIVGQTNGSLGGPNQGSSDVWVAKYDADGNLAWTQQLGTPFYESSGGITTDADGNVYLVGETSGPLGGPRRGGEVDGWLAKFDPAGNVLWTEQIGTPQNDSAKAVTTFSSGANTSVYVAGDTDGSLNRNYGLWDVFLAKYAAAP